MNDIHIKISSEIDNKLRNYCKINGYNLSQGINNLIEFGLKKIDYTKQLDSNTKYLSKIYSKNVYIIELIEKMYSDLEIDNNTNPKDNKSLQEFKISKLRDKFDE